MNMHRAMGFFWLYLECWSNEVIETVWVSFAICCIAALDWQLGRLLITLWLVLLDTAAFIVALRIHRRVQATIEKVRAQQGLYENRRRKWED